MRPLVLASILSLAPTCAQAAYLTATNPNDDVNWVPVTIEAPPEFGAFSSIGANTVFPDTDGTYANVNLPAAPYQFWLRRGANPHPSSSTWWVDIRLWFIDSPIGGGLNYLQLHRDEATAAALVLRPQPQFFPPMTPPNDRVVWSRFWTVDDGTPRDALVPTDFRLVPEPSTALIAITASAVGMLALRRRTEQV